MSEILLVRQPGSEISESDREVVRRVLFGIVDGLGEVHQKRWRRLVNRWLKMEPGEVQRLVSEMERSGPYHRRHFLIEQTVFNAQERFDSFEGFRFWCKVGAGWVTWTAGPKGGVVPIPRSVSYAAADQDEFSEFHTQVMAFLRQPYAASYLWPHLKYGRADAMMNDLLGGFGE